MKEVVRCHHCNAKMVEYKHSINKNMVACLKVILEFGGVMPFKEFNNKVTYNQRNNFQKLQYWRLVQKVKDDLSEERIGGLWALTRFGKDFLMGLERVQRSVWTYRNQVVRFEGEAVSVSDLGFENYRQRDDYVSDQRPRYLNTEGQFEFFPEGEKL